MKTRPRGMIESWRPHQKTEERLRQIREILAVYAEQLPLTIRQIFYRLVARYAYEKTETAYKNLIELLNVARRARALPFDAIRDDGFMAAEPFHYRDAAGFFATVRHMADTFRLDRQAGQRQRLALWCEAGGMVPQLEAVADPFGIPVYSSGGFDSTTKKHDLAAGWRDTDRPVTLLHIGDQDPSGVHNTQALAEDLIAFCGPGLDVEVVRIALLPAQVEDLPTAPPKPTDRRRFDRMMIRTGTGQEHEFVTIDPTETWQAEALDPATLAAIVQRAIEARVDQATLNGQLALEAETRQDVISRLGRIA